MEGLVTRLPSVIYGSAAVLNEFYVTVLQLLMMTLESSMGQLLHPLAQDRCLATFHSLFPLSPSNKLLLYSPNNLQVPHSPSNKLFPQKLLLAHQLSFHYHQF